MLEASDAQTLDTQPAQDAVQDSMQGMRVLIERMQAELKFEKTRNEALNFEIARLKRWRFGSSSESLEASTQAALFDAIVADTLLEDIAAQQETKPAPSARASRASRFHKPVPTLQRSAESSLTGSTRPCNNLSTGRACTHVASQYR